MRANLVDIPGLLALRGLRAVGLERVLKVTVLWEIVLARFVHSPAVHRGDLRNPKYRRRQHRRIGTR